MLWMAVQTVRKDIHVYPGQETQEHTLDDRLCNCMPEVLQTAAGRLVVHQKISNQHRLHAHWIGK